MLRASAEHTDRPADTAALRGATGDADGGVPGGRELIALARAVVTASGPHDPELVRTRRAASVAVGDRAAARAVAVAANFEMMNRVVDAGGLPFTAGMAEMGRALGVPTGEH